MTTCSAIPVPPLRNRKPWREARSPYKMHYSLPAGALALTILLTACADAPEATAQSPTLTTDTAVTTAMDRETLADLYALNAQLFDNVTFDLTEADARRRLSDSTNSPQWIAGHVLDIQYNLAALTGAASENPYAEDFAFGKPFDGAADYPTLGRMRADFAALAPQIEAALRQLPAETLDADSPFPIPFNQQTIRGVLAFQMHHLAYEIGQLGLYRRFLGKAAMQYGPRG